MDLSSKEVSRYLRGSQYLRTAFQNTRILYLHHHNESSNCPKKRLDFLRQSLEAVETKSLFPELEELWLPYPWRGLQRVSHPQRELFFKELGQFIGSSRKLCRLRFSDTIEASCKGTVGFNISRANCSSKATQKILDSSSIYELCISITQSFIGSCLGDYSDEDSSDDEKADDRLDLQTLLRRFSDWTPHITGVKVGHRYCYLLDGVSEEISLRCECGFCFRCRMECCSCELFAIV